MSVIETRQDALEGKMSQVIATTAANMELLEELKLVFTNYITKLKDTSNVSPSMSKSAMDNDGAALVWSVKPTTPTEVCCLQEAINDTTDTLDFDSECATLPEDNKKPVALPKSTKCNPPLAPVTILVQPSKAELVRVFVWSKVLTKACFKFEFFLKWPFQLKRQTKIKANAIINRAIHKVSQQTPVCMLKEERGDQTF